MKQILDTLTAGQSRIQEHFHFLHQNPGLAFEETVAANYIAGKLREWGYEVTEGIGQTGVVARLKVGDGQASIGLRADTDALPVQEGADLPYKSRIEGQSHMCGHDAHASMLLGAAEYLAKTRHFNGTLNLIFQPAEEIMAGAPGMIADGLFEKFPMDAMFGIQVSTGSACASHKQKVSPTLRAMGLSQAQADGTVRVSLGALNTMDEMDEAARHMLALYRMLRQFKRR